LLWGITRLWVIGDEGCGRLKTSDFTKIKDAGFTP